MSKKSGHPEMDETILEMSDYLYRIGKLPYEKYKRMTLNHGGIPLEEPTDSESLMSFRKRHKLTQAELALLIRVSPSTVTKWETGKSAIPGSMFLLLGILDRNGLDIATNGSVA